MFEAIAGRYDLLNRVLSLGTDQRWRQAACEALGAAPGEMAADLCCGTGDLSLALADRGALVVGVDFSREMLKLAASKGVPLLAEADCLHLPFPDGVLDIVSVAFGVRNLSDPEGGLREMLRVLRPGGRLGILEFASPRGALLRPVYRTYLRWIVPAVGALISRRGSAYGYLASSITGFHDQSSMKALLRQAGFESVGHIDLSRGISALYTGRRPTDRVPAMDPPPVHPQRAQG
jgi:demethylmenaquinone methyltransferase/2-methoxy-6-polyprenyl-1,4-benzoquinol methylase